jgi:hypothetical protein
MTDCTERDVRTERNDRTEGQEGMTKVAQS